MKFFLLSNRSLIFCQDCGCSVCTKSGDKKSSLLWFLRTGGRRIGRSVKVQKNPNPELNLADLSLRLPPCALPAAVPRSLLFFSWRINQLALSQHPSLQQPFHQLCWPIGKWQSALWWTDSNIGTPDVAVGRFFGLYFSFHVSGVVKAVDRWGMPNTGRRINQDVKAFFSCSVNPRGSPWPSWQKPRALLLLQMCEALNLHRYYFI